MASASAGGQPATPAAPPPPTAPGLMESVEALWHDLLGLGGDYLRLAALETQRAGESLVAIVVFGIVVGVLVVSAWLGLAGALVLWLMENGVNGSLAMLAAVLFNLAGAFGFVLAIRAKSYNLRFPATVKSLGPNRDKPIAVEPP
ncbi:MAG: phage holin family protein [Betaproteobacteria bacterium]